MSPLPPEKILLLLNDPKLELDGIQFSETMVEQFQEFCALLQKWNDKINLTSEKDALSILEKHVFDSLHYLRWIDPSHKTLDIGSGGGFPGIPIKLMRPDLDLTLLDSQKKRCSFLREAIRSLKLEQIKVAEGRVESFFSLDHFSEQFDRVCFRGFSSFDNCLEVGLPFLKTGGRIILKKDSKELPDSTDEILHNARIMETKEVAGFDGHVSLMMIIEKCST